MIGQKQTWVWSSSLMVVLVNALLVSANTFFDDGEMHVIDTVINDYIYVYDGPDAATTSLNVVQGGWPGGSSYTTWVFDHSQINVMGGRITHLNTTSYTGLHLSDGDITNLFAGGESDVVVSDSGYLNNATLDNHVTFSSTGGNTSYITSRSNSQVSISAGWVGHISAYSSSVVNITGGTVQHHIIAYDDSRVVISGGILNDFSFTPIGSLRAGRGDTDPTNSIITIHGSDFAIDGSPVDYGVLTNSSGGRYTTGQLTGSLMNGGAIDRRFEIWGDGSIVLIPEPCMLWLLGLGMVCRWRRKR